MSDTPSTQETPARSARYTLPAILFHWTSFALVVFVGVLGLSFGNIPRPNRLFWINIHAVVGLAVLALAVRAHPPRRPRSSKGSGGPRRTTPRRDRADRSLPATAD